MQEKNMESIDCDMNSVIPWRFETNWLISQGSLKDSVTVESSEYPIDESDPEISNRKSRLILKPRDPDCGPCEIKICFEHKYEVGQVYVRSTARTYEIYCEHSPHTINEYLCTVRCGIAERDDKVLQTNCIEDVSEEPGECPSGNITAETVRDGGNIVTGEDDWVNIKVPEAGKSSASDNISANGLNNIQDYYEATAQISDSEPCLSLTIRLLSLQDRGHVYVDEIYVFVDPMESTDYGNEAMVAGSSTQSSLMAKFMPTLLQLSRSGVNRVQDRCASDEVIKDDKMGTELRMVDEIDSHQQDVMLRELDKPEPPELKDTPDSSGLQQHTSVEKRVDPESTEDSRPGRLEMAVEQLISRLNRVEDICLRFEEKMLKPIESMEARLQRVENQLEKLVRNSHDSGLPHCTRISAPAFSCSESSSSSLYNDESIHPPHEAPDLEKEDMPELLHDANFHPGLVVSAPEFSSGEGEEDIDDLRPLKDSPCVKPKKTLSLDDALAASLDGFLSTAAINASARFQTIGISSRVSEEQCCKGHAESCNIEPHKSTAADNVSRESPRFAQVLTVEAPDFTAEEMSNERQLNYAKTSLDTASVMENEDDGNKIVPTSTHCNNLLSSIDSHDIGKSGGTNDFESTANGDLTVSVKDSGTCFYRGHLNGSSEVNVIGSYFEGDTSSASAIISNGSTPDLPVDSIEMHKHQNSDEITLLGKSARLNKDGHNDASEQVSGHEYEYVSKDIERYIASGMSPPLDFQFPILEVKFTSDSQSSTNSPLEALLGGLAESNTEACLINGTRDDDDDGHTEQLVALITDGNETRDILPDDYPLVDVGVSAGDGVPNMEDISNHCTPKHPGNEGKLYLMF